MPKIHQNILEFCRYWSASFWYCHWFWGVILWSITDIQQFHNIFVIFFFLSLLYAFNRIFVHIVEDVKKEPFEIIYLIVINSYDRWNVSWRPPKRLWFLKTAWHRVIHVIDSIKWVLPILFIFFLFFLISLNFVFKVKKNGIPIPIAWRLVFVVVVAYSLYDRIRAHRILSSFYFFFFSCCYHKTAAFLFTKIESHK